MCCLSEIWYSCKIQCQSVNVLLWMEAFLCVLEVRGLWCAQRSDGRKACSVCQSSPGGTRVANTWDLERLPENCSLKRAQSFVTPEGFSTSSCEVGTHRLFVSILLKGSKLYLQYLKSCILLSLSFHLPGKLFLLSCSMFKGALLHSSAFNSPLTMQGCNSWNCNRLIYILLFVRAVSSQLFDMS